MIDSLTYLMLRHNDINSQLDSIDLDLVSAALRTPYFIKAVASQSHLITNVVQVKLNEMLRISVLVRALCTVDAWTGKSKLQRSQTS